jgi:tRNA (guanine-N7-)-methyltransferase
MGAHRSRRQAEGAFLLTSPALGETERAEGAERDGFAPRRLYGRSRGKALRERQTRLVDELLPRLSIASSGPLPEPRTLFPGPVDDVWLEIGFGGGEHLVAAAAARPDVGFIGCEPFVNGMARLLARIDAAGLTNIRLFAGDAIEVVERLPDASLGRVFVLYPDPWPKRRHHKRRIVSPENLGKLARVMRRGAQLRFATDIDDYAGWTLARVLASPDFLWTAETARDWREPFEGRVRTKYEAKAIAAGRKPVYLTFERR